MNTFGESYPVIGLPCVVVFRIDFDNMENHAPKETRLRAVLVGSTPEAASIQAERFIELERKEDSRDYRGYDGKTYPQWYVECGTVGAVINGRKIVGI